TSAVRRRIALQGERVVRHHQAGSTTTHAGLCAPGGSGRLPQLAQLLGARVHVDHGQCDNRWHPGGRRGARDRGGTPRMEPGKHRIVDGDGGDDGDEFADHGCSPRSSMGPGPLETFHALAFASARSPRAWKRGSSAMSTAWPSMTCTLRCARVASSGSWVTITMVAP